MAHSDVAALPFPLPLTTSAEELQVRALGAKNRVHQVLQKVYAADRADSGRGDSAGRHRDIRNAPVADATPSSPRGTSYCTTKGVSPPFTFRPCKLERPLTPLLQRAEKKKTHDAVRQRRRAAREAAKAASAAPAMSVSAVAADMVRTALSQPFGAMAARFLSAASLTAPSLFPDATGATGNHDLTSTPVPSRPPSPQPKPILSPPPIAAMALPGETQSVPGRILASFTCKDDRAADRFGDGAADPPEDFSPEDSYSPQMPVKAELHRSCGDHQQMQYGGGSPPPQAASKMANTSRRPTRLPLLLSQSSPVAASVDGPRSGKMPLGRPGTRDERHHHHHDHHCHRSSRWRHWTREAADDDSVAALSAVQKRGEPTTVKTQRRSSNHENGAPTSQEATASSSIPTGILGSSPIGRFARRLRETSLASVLTASPLTPNETQRVPAADSHHRHSCSAGVEYLRSHHATSSGVRHGYSRQHCRRSSPSTTSLRLIPKIRDDGEILPSTVSSTSLRFRHSGWDDSESCDSTCSSRSFSLSGALPPTFSPAASVIIPMESRYDPHALMPSLLRCYADSLTRELFTCVPSTSTEQTASCASTPRSSEWSVESSGSAAAETAVAAAWGSEPLEPSSECGWTDVVADRRMASGKSRPQSHSRRRHPSPPPLSLTTNTLQSYVAEMDAIEQGMVAPYVSYLFSPEVRVLDLGELQSEKGRRNLAPQLEATCIAFVHGANAYLVGTSSGLLWRVPVTGSAEVVRATPLGSLWPPPALQPLNTNATAVKSPDESSVLQGMQDSSTGSALQPVPLPGHTAAILSIAFNDDGSLFATSGVDRCIILWKTSTSAKLRRIRAVCATPLPAAAPTTNPAVPSLWSGVTSTAGEHAPHLVRFMPQNNNYLLVSYLGGRELHLYNSSTGLPVTNVAGISKAHTSNAISTPAKNRRKGVVRNVGDGTSLAGPCGDAITALAVDPIASPFFFSGDAKGTVMLWTYLGGNLAVWPTLRATTSGTAASTSSPLSSGEGRVYGVDRVVRGRGTKNRESMVASTSPLHQPPELRRVASLALPPHLGGIAAIGVTALHVPQLHSLLRRRGPGNDPATKVPGTAEHHAGHKGSSASSTRAEYHSSLEATARVFHTVAQQNRSIRAETEMHHGTGAKSVAYVTRHGSAHSREASTTAATATLKNDSIPHLLAALPSRLSEKLSVLWGGGAASSISSSHAPVPKPTKSASSSSPASVTEATMASTPPTTAISVAPTERELMRQLRDDALDAVCPLLILVTVPSDTIYALGLLLELQQECHRGDARGAGVVANPANARYRLYPLLTVTSPSRLRHLGVGATQSPDNQRLVVVATPCEEGFVRVEPLLSRAAPPPPSTPCPPSAPQSTSTMAAAVETSVSSASVSRAAEEEVPCRRSHVLATLPMPYGGRCTGLAWSLDGRFLVAITAEGVVYQWNRVYLVNPSCLHGSGAAAPESSTTAHARLTDAEGDRGDLHYRKGNGRAGRAIPSMSPPVIGATAARGGVDLTPTAARHQSFVPDYSTVGPRSVTPAGNFTSLLGTSITATVTVNSSAALTGVNDLARAVFSEEDAWRESLLRELERQRQMQAALRLIRQPKAGEEDLKSDDSYWHDDDAADSAGTENTTEETG